MQIASPLINELQCGERLNHAIEHGRRGEFALLLAMLSQDARDMAQFTLGEEGTVDAKLRRQFELPPAQTLVADVADDSLVNNGGEFHELGLRGFALQQALKPEALVTRGPISVTMLDALNNTDPLCKSRYLEPQHPALPEIPHFNDRLSGQLALAQRMAQA
ncbi:queD-like protein [Shewanella cyperi]|uniref:QueD-like protein n=1 Tax=Shewanella cyperi TaxID=2814292 RepID=A0A974XNI0_9GAMM|nr:VC2046/SO_2500 family protein [Shewanella cyperi]QSX31639.1 queD-like protein [Shewanella cyperi]